MRLFLFVYFFLVAGVYACPEHSPVLLRESPAEQGATAPRGVVLFIHGLNNNDSIFNAIAEDLRRAGFHALFLTLTAHTGRAQDKQCASADRLLHDFHESLRYIQLKFERSLPVYVVAYSLGGVIATAGLADLPSNAIRAMVFLSPALSIRTYTQLVRLTFPFGWFNLSLPSMAPAVYSAYTTTAINSYRALFATRELANHFLNTHPVLPPTLLLVHNKDELVSPEGLADLLEEQNIPNWQLERLDIKKADKKLNYHHLFAKEFFQEKDWQAILDRIRDFLLEN